MTMNKQAVQGLRDDQLTHRLYELRGDERRILVEFLIYLAEVDRRRLYAAVSYSSLFAFCTDHLGLSKGATFRRITAARLTARFPILLEYLADGRLTLTTLAELRNVLEELGDTRLDEILARAQGRNEDQVKELVAALRPQPAQPDLFRRAPAPQPASPAAVAAPECVEPREVPAPRERPAGRIEPISEEHRVLRVTVGREFAADLEAA